VQPSQQQGRRIPDFNLDRALVIRIFLVSAFLPEVTQQIHSLRASGVMSSHTAFADGAEARALRKSCGSECTAPADDFGILLFYQMNYAICYDVDLYD
jgi:hypothetical protein